MMIKCYAWYNIYLDINLERNGTQIECCDVDAHNAHTKRNCIILGFWVRASDSYDRCNKDEPEQTNLDDNLTIVSVDSISFECD